MSKKELTKQERDMAASLEGVAATELLERVSKSPAV